MIGASGKDINDWN